MTSHSVGVKIGEWLLKFRITTFVTSVILLKRKGLPMTKHNLRALWITSDPNFPPLGKRDPAALKITDEEWEAFEKAMEEL